MIIRRARLDDLRGIATVLEQLLSGNRAGREAMWPRLLEDSTYAAWVAEEEGRIAGFVDLLTWPDIGHGGTMGLINNLIVDAQARGAGLGSRLLEAVIAYCRAHAVAELHVWTDSDNERALRTYKKLGFVDRGRVLELVL